MCVCVQWDKKLEHNLSYCDTLLSNSAIHSAVCRTAGP